MREIDIVCNQWQDEIIEARNRYDRLIVVRHIPPNENYTEYVDQQDDQARWLCLCNCGKIRVVTKECLVVCYVTCCVHCEELQLRGDSYLQNKFYTAARRRNEQTCQKCGRNQGQRDRKLDVHHINTIHEDDRKENVTILCRSCHMVETQRIRNEQLAVQETQETQAALHI